MAYAPNTYTTNGTDRDYNITFPFLRESDIRVTVFDASGNLLTDSADYDFSIQKPDATFQVRVVQNGTINNSDGGTALASGSTVTISRVTDISTLVTVFQDGASLRASDINALISQINYALEEFGDNTTSALGKNITQTAWDATSLRITNLAQPTADNDAIRKVDVDSGIGPDITTVAGIAANVTSVANDATDIGVLAADISGTNTIGTVSTNIANVNAVGGDIANVNAVAGNATNINAVAGNATNINAVAADAADINTIVANLADINTVAADTADIGTVAADIQVGGPDNIGTVANAVGDVGIVAGINGQVQTVAGAIANVNTVAADTADIGTVASNIADVNTVAGISSDVTSLAPQATNISTLTQAANLTALQNAQANATAAQSALAQLNNKYHGSHTNVAGNDAEVLADIANDANLTLEAGDLYFDSTNSKLRYYDGSAWYNAAAAQVINTTSLQNVGDVNAYVGLTTDDFLKYDGAGWQNVTPTAVKSALAISNTDVSGLGTAAVENVGAFATAAQGALADTAVQQNDSPTFFNLTAQDVDVTKASGTTRLTVESTDAGTVRQASVDLTNTLRAYRVINDFNGRLSIYDQTGGAERLGINTSGQLKAAGYGSGTHTGTAAKSLAVDSSGNVIEEQDLSSTATPSFGTVTATRASYPAYNVQETGGVGHGQLAASGTEVQLRNVGTGSLSFFTDNSRRATIDATGNVGIGTQTPDTLVEMVGADPVLTIRDSETSIANSSATLRLAETGAGDTLDEYWDTQLFLGAYRVAYAGNPRLTIDRTSGEVQTLNSGQMVSIRKADRRTTTGTHSLVGGATLYYANAAATYDTASLTPGDIVTIYNEGGGAVTVNTGGTVSLFKDGEASAVTAAVTIGADTIATVTCVSATKAIIAGSDLT